MGGGAAMIEAVKARKARRCKAVCFGGEREPGAKDCNGTRQGNGFSLSPPTSLVLPIG